MIAPDSVSGIPTFPSKKNHEYYHEEQIHSQTVSEHHCLRTIPPDFAAVDGLLLTVAVLILG